MESDGRVPYGYLSTTDGVACWLDLPWQQRLFWRAVGQPEPGWRRFFPGLIDRAWPKEKKLPRADRAARDLLLAILGEAGVGWRPKLPPSAKAVAEAKVRAERYVNAEREIVRLKSEDQNVPDSLYDELFVELGQ